MGGGEGRCSVRATGGGAAWGIGEGKTLSVCNRGRSLLDLCRTPSSWASGVPKGALTVELGPRPRHSRVPQAVFIPSPPQLSVKSQERQLGE